MYYDDAMIGDRANGSERGLRQALVNGAAPGEQLALNASQFDVTALFG
jgi:hypothetical protein